METKKIKLPLGYRNVKDPDLLFDLVCFRNFMAGNMDIQIPVEESRQVFEEIKRLLALPKKRKTK